MYVNIRKIYYFCQVSFNQNTMWTADLGTFILTALCAHIINIFLSSNMINEYKHVRQNKMETVKK